MQHRSCNWTGGRSRLLILDGGSLPLAATCCLPLPPSATTQHDDEMTQHSTASQPCVRCCSLHLHNRREHSQWLCNQHPTAPAPTLTTPSQTSANPAPLPDTHDTGPATSLQCNPARAAAQQVPSPCPQHLALPCVLPWRRHMLWGATKTRKTAFVSSWQCQHLTYHMTAGLCPCHVSRPY